MSPTEAAQRPGTGQAITAAQSSGSATEASFRQFQSCFRGLAESITSEKPTSQHRFAPLGSPIG
jgi:hypothetical protein